MTDQALFCRQARAAVINVHEQDHARLACHRRSEYTKPALRAVWRYEAIFEKWLRLDFATCCKEQCGGVIY